MAEAFPVSGNIEPAAFPHLLVDLHRHGATGSLKVTGPVHPKALYFRGGRILFGSSNDPRDQLGAILIESGKITRGQLDEVNAKVGPGNPLAKVLAESGFVNQRELGDAARVKVERILADVLSWESGSFEFEDGVLPKGAVDLKLSTERLLLAAVQRIPERSFVLRHVGQGEVLEPIPEAEAALSEIRADVWPLLERLDGHRSLKDAIALTRLDDFEASKTACALLFLGVVRKGAVAGEEVDLAQEAQRGFGMPEAEAPSYTMPMEPVAAFSPEPETEIGFVAPEPEPTPVVAPEPTGFALAEPEEEPPAPFYSEPEEESPAAETVEFPVAPLEPPEAPAPAPIPVPAPQVTPPPPAPTALPDAPSFIVEPRVQRPGTDTQPGDRPAYSPPPAAPATPAFEPAPPPEPFTPAPPTSRPTQEDLAALDALLNPSSAARPSSSPPLERSRPERWEPPVRPATIPPRRPSPRTAPPSSGPSRAPIVAAVAGVALATAAAWYLFLRTPSTRTAASAPPPVSTMPPPTSPPPVPATMPALVPSPSESAASSPAPAVAPTPLATATPAPPPSATPTPAPRPTPSATPAARPTPPVTPTPAARTPSATGGTGEARALLRQGALSQAAKGFASALAPGAAGRFSLQLLAACAPDTVQKAVSAAGADELFILPVSVKGRECYRVCWGVYDTREAAEAATREVPAYFRQGGTPRLQPLADLLP
jgi:hypothetical protein